MKCMKTCSNVGYLTWSLSTLKCKFCCHTIRPELQVDESSPAVPLFSEEARNRGPVILGFWAPRHSWELPLVIAMDVRDSSRSHCHGPRLPVQWPGASKGIPSHVWEGTDPGVRVQLQILQGNMPMLKEGNGHEHFTSKSIHILKFTATCTIYGIDGDDAVQKLLFGEN